jgi:hypothetical protein
LNNTMLEDAAERLRSLDAKIRVRTLNTLGGSPDVREEVVLELERLLDDRTVARLAIPIRFGEVRYLAGEVLAATRARRGDLRAIHMSAVPRTLNVDQMVPLRRTAGIPLFGGPEPLACYEALRNGGYIPVADVVFEPKAYLV